MTYDYTAALQTDKMIGTDRQDLLEQVIRAIKDNKKEYVFYLVGMGGIGKTRFLSEIGKTVKHVGKAVRWSNIVDLYQSEMHSNTDIERKLAENLDPKNEYFEPYHTMRNEFDEVRDTGVGGSLLQRKRQELTQKFIECLNELSKDYRLVLTFDTLELVQYESEDIRDLCEIKGENTSVKNWLLNQIPHFSNCVTVFSGREHRELQVEFEDKFQQTGSRYKGHYIDKLSKRDAKTFLKELAVHCSVLEDVDQELFDKIFRGSENGRPIYLSLAADLASHDSTSLSELFENPQELRRKIAYRLWNDLPEQHCNIIRYLVFARQGLDVPLLCHLDSQMSQKRAEDLFDEMRQYTFIKHAESSIHPAGQLFLHDEVFDILDQERLRDLDQDTRPKFERIRNYYAAQQKKLTTEFESILESKDSYKTTPRRTKQRELENAKVKQLHYELQLNPLQAYWQLYNRWAEEAIKSHHTGLDMRLLDTVLHFFRYVQLGYTWYQDNQEAQHTRYSNLNSIIAQHEDEFKRNSAVLWIRRYNARGEFEKAKRIAQKIKRSRKKAFAWKQTRDPLYQGALLTALGEAMSSTISSQDETLRTLNSVLSLLNTKEDFSALDKDEPWRWAEILGRANNNIGFAYRLNNQFSTAINYYRKAIELYRQVDVLHQMAASITNLAYVYAQLGAIDEAEALAEDAVAIWQRRGQPYNLALSYNAWGLICLLADQPHRARAFCEQADQLFSDLVAGEGHLSELRGRGLSQLALGETMRRLANLFFLQVYDEKEAVGFLQKGRDYLQTAIDIFKETDKRQLLRAYAELGRLYRDWTAILCTTNKKQDAQERQYQAQDFLEKARNLAQENKSLLQVADLSLDLVSLYYAAEQQNMARRELKTAQASVDKQYRPKEGDGFKNPPINPIDSYWQVLGKMYFLQAQMSFDRGTSLAETQHDNDKMIYIREGILYFVQAVACFQQYATVVPFSHDPKMKQTKITIYHLLKSYKRSRLQEIMEFTRKTAEQYCVSDKLEPMILYLERTLGI